MSSAHREYFNRLASSWDSNVAEAGELQAYMRQFGVGRNDRILDIGSGTGRLAKVIHRLLGPQGCLVAEDISEQMLFQAKQSIRTPRLNFICGDVCAMSHVDVCFDKVVCFSAFPHFSRPLLALHEIYRVLRKQGKLLILHTRCSRKINEFHAQCDKIVCQDRLPCASELAQMLQRTGFLIARNEEHPGLYWVEAIKPL